MAELPNEKIDPFKEIMTATSDSKQARQLGHGNGESRADLEAHKNAVTDQPDEDAEAEQPCEQAKPGHRESRKACDLHIALRIAFGVVPIVAGLAYKGASAYLTPAIGNARLRVTQAGTKTVLIDSGTLTFSNSEVATLFVIGSAANGGGAPYSGQLLNP